MTRAIKDCGSAWCHAEAQENVTTDEHRNTDGAVSDPLTQRIIGCAIAVSHEPAEGSAEKVRGNVLACGLCWLPCTRPNASMPVCHGLPACLLLNRSRRRWN